MLLALTFCTPKGPQTFGSNFIGKTKTQLITAKGAANKIKVFDNSEAIIYIKREEFYGKKVKDPLPEKPKRINNIEYIYYINSDNMVYKYQVWKKKVKK